MDQFPHIRNVHILTVYFLRWYDQACEGYQPSLILRNKTLLTALSAAPKLKQLSISFENNYHELESSSLDCFIPLKGFSNLTSLEIYNFYGKQAQLVEELAALLSRCPGLKTLGLGLSCDADFDIFPESVVIEGDLNFLESLCLAYGSFADGPLPLDTLRLGWGMCVFESNFPEVGNFLKLLFKADTLRTLHVFNGLIHLGSIEEEADDMSISWNLLENCTSLHQISVTRLDDDVLKWLHDMAKNVKELLFSGSSIFPKNIYISNIKCSQGGICLIGLFFLVSLACLSCSDVLGLCILT